MGKRYRRNQIVNTIMPRLISWAFCSKYIKNIIWFKISLSYILISRIKRKSLTSKLTLNGIFNDFRSYNTFKRFRTSPKTRDVLNSIRFVIFKHVILSVSFLVCEISFIFLPSSLGGIFIIKSRRILSKQFSLGLNFITAIENIRRWVKWIFWKTTIITGIFQQQLSSHWWDQWYHQKGKPRAWFCVWSVLSVWPRALRWVQHLPADIFYQDRGHTPFLTWKNAEKNARWNPV